MNVIKSAFGYYEPRGYLESPDYIVGVAFGTTTDALSVNRALAKYILAHEQPTDVNRSPRTVITDRTLAEAFPRAPAGTHYILRATMTDFAGHGSGTRGTIREATEYIGDKDWILACQACHIGRAAFEAHLLGTEPVVPPGLPRKFDPRKENTQAWCRSLSRWAMRELPYATCLVATRRLPGIPPVA